MIYLYVYLPVAYLSACLPIHRIPACLSFFLSFFLSLSLSVSPSTKIHLCPTHLSIALCYILYFAPWFILTYVADWFFCLFHLFFLSIFVSPSFSPFSLSSMSCRSSMPTYCFRSAYIFFIYSAYSNLLKSEAPLAQSNLYIQSKHSFILSSLIFYNLVKQNRKQPLVTSFHLIRKGDLDDKLPGCGTNVNRQLWDH